MKSGAFRPAFFVVAVASFVLVAHGRAFAVVEYCGATAGLTPVGVADDVPATLFAMSLRASSARSVSGHVAVQADNAWYDIAFDNVNLAPRARRFRSPTVEFTRTEFESPMLFVTFSAPTLVRDVFVQDATVTNEHDLGWDSQPHACAGHEYDSKQPAPRRVRDIVVLDPDPSPTAPPAGTPMLHAAITNVPGSTDCPHPFASANVKHAIPPEFPRGYTIDQTFTSLIEVAVGANGGLDDAWVYAPSGVKAFDDAAIRAAKESTFQAPRAFCKDVPGVYLFRAEFRP